MRRVDKESEQWFRWRLLIAIFGAKFITPIRKDPLKKDIYKLSTWRDKSI